MDEHNDRKVEDLLFAEKSPFERGGSQWGKWLAGAGQAIFVICVYVGGLAMFIWSLRLIYVHWGGFWALIGFTFPPFVLVVAVMCFFWGVWYYILGLLGVIVAFCGTASEDKPIAAFLLATVLTLTAGLGYVGWQDAITPDPITPRVQRQLNADATLVVTLLRASGNEDPELAVKLNRAVDELREDLDRLDSAQLDEVIRHVDAHLVYRREFERDIVRFMESLITGRATEFEISGQTLRAMQALPEEMRQLTEKDALAFSAFLALEMGDDMPTPRDIPDGWREVMDSAIAVQWNTRAHLYEQMLGREMPMPAEVENVALLPQLYGHLEAPGGDVDP